MCVPESQKLPPSTISAKCNFTHNGRQRTLCTVVTKSLNHQQNDKLNFFVINNENKKFLQFLLVYLSNLLCLTTAAGINIAINILYYGKREK